jgi:hypothetical protein
MVVFKLLLYLLVGVFAKTISFVFAQVKYFYQGGKVRALNKSKSFSTFFISL